jgi:hypothetical protein
MIPAARSCGPGVVWAFESWQAPNPDAAPIAQAIARKYALRLPIHLS